MPPLDRTQRPGSSPIERFRFPEARRSELDGGLRIVTVERPGNPVFYGEIVYPAGAEHEPSERPGLATLTVALMDEGTGRHNATELAEAVDQLGGFLQTSAGWNAAYLSFGGLGPCFESLLELVADVTVRPDFAERELARLKAERSAEIARRSADPASIASRGLAEAVYGDGTYSASLLGNDRSLEEIDRDAIVRFHREHVTREGSTLVVVGPDDHDRLVELARRHLQEWSGALAPTSEIVPPEPKPQVEVHLFDRPGSSQTELRIAHVGVPRNHPDHAVLVVLNSILGGKFTSRLNLNLREEKGLTYGVHSRFARRRGHGPFVVSTAISTDSVGLATAETLREIERLRTEPVPQSELDDARGFIVGVFPYTLQTNEGLAQRLVDLAMYDLPDDYFERYFREIDAVDPDALVRAARKHLTPDRAVVVAVGPAEELAAQLEPLGQLTVHEAPSATS